MDEPLYSVGLLVVICLGLVVALSLCLTAIGWWWRVWLALSRMMQRLCRRHPGAVSTVDSVVVCACWLLAYAFRYHPWRHGRSLGHFVNYLVVTPLVVWTWWVTYRLFRLGRVIRGPEAQWRQVAKATATTTVILFVVLEFEFSGYSFSAKSILYFWLMSTAALVAIRSPTVWRLIGHVRELLVRFRAWLVEVPSWRLRVGWWAEPLVAGVAVALLAGSYVAIGQRTGFIPCTLDCGETYHAYIGAWNLYRFGWRYAGGLEDVATGPDTLAHPTLYTHNPNLGMYVRYLLLLLGIWDIHEQAVWTFIPFGLGLLYMYLFVRAVSRSGFIAALCLINASGLYALVSLWAFHGLRVFSWLLTFGPLFHLYASSRRQGTGRHLGAAIGYLALSFGIDYPFAVFNLVNVLGLALAKVIRMPRRRLVAVLVLGIGIPFALRQVQVAAVVGFRFWTIDFAYSLLHRLPLVARVVHAPAESGLRSLYIAHHVLRWPDPGGSNPVEWARLVFGAYASILGVPFICLVVAWGVVVGLLSSWKTRCLARRIGRLPVILTVVISNILGAQGVTFILFGSYFSSTYGSSLMPLPVHWIVLLLGLTTWLLLANARRVWPVGRIGVPIGALLLGLFVVWRVGTDVRNEVLLPPVGYPGRQVLERMKGHSFVTYWISTPVSAYTAQWAAVLQGPRWRTVDPRDLPFRPGRDFFAFFQADGDAPRYTRPEFLFIPAIPTAALTERRCDAFRGRVAVVVDGCVNLDAMATRLRFLPLHSRGRDYLLYDLRGAYPTDDQRTGQRRG